METWDCVVVGGGIIGSWAGYHLARAGQKVLLLDQFMLPHGRGGSSGASRITRMAYTKDVYAAMMPESFEWWHKLEKDTDTKLFERTGIMLLQHKDSAGHVEDSREVMERQKLPYVDINPGDLAKSYPQLSFSDDYYGLVDPKAGLLLSNRCILAVQNAFRKAGGRIHDLEPVEKVVPGSVIEVVTPSNTYRARKLVIATGPWSTDLLSTIGVNVPVRPMPGLSLYFKVKPDYLSHYSCERFPTLYTYMYYKPGNYRFVCVFPCLEYPGMVKLITRGEPPPYYCHPDDRDSRGSQDLVNILVQFVKDRLSGVDPTPKIMEPCVYSMTPDRDFIIDKHPQYSNIVFGAGFSGHGFMRAPVVGKLLMELAVGHKPSHDLAGMALGRFNTSSKL